MTARREDARRYATLVPFVVPFLLAAVFLTTSACGVRAPLRGCARGGSRRFVSLRGTGPAQESAPKPTTSGGGSWLLRRW